MHDLWEASLPVEPYSWTVPVLEELAARQLPVVLLSDAWPSLRRFYRELGLEVHIPITRHELSAPFPDRLARKPV